VEDSEKSWYLWTDIKEMAQRQLRKNDAVMVEVTGSLLDKEDAPLQTLYHCLTLFPQ